MTLELSSVRKKVFDALCYEVETNHELSRYITIKYTGDRHWGKIEIGVYSYDKLFILSQILCRIENEMLKAEAEELKAEALKTKSDKQNQA